MEQRARSLGHSTTRTVRTLTLALTLTLTLTACTGETPQIPPQFQGVWSDTAGDCDEAEGETMIIDEQSISFAGRDYRIANRETVNDWRVRLWSEPDAASQPSAPPFGGPKPFELALDYKEDAEGEVELLDAIYQQRVFMTYERCL